MVNLRQTQEIENKIAELLVNKFDISDSLLKEVTKKITSISNKRVEETLKKTKDFLPSKGFTGIIKENLKPASNVLSSFKLPKDLFKDLRLPKIPEFKLPKDLFKDLRLPKIPEFKLPENLFKDLRLPKIPEFKLPENLFKDLKLPKIPEFKLPKDLFKDLKLPKIPEFKLPENLFKDLKLPKIPEFKLPENLFKDLRLPKIPEFKLPENLFKDLRLPKIPEFKLPKDLFKDLRLPKIPEFKLPKDLFKDLRLPKIPEFKLPENLFKDLRLPKIPEFKLPENLFKDLKLPKIPEFKLPKDLFKDLRLPKIPEFKLPKDLFKDLKLPKIPEFKLPKLPQINTSIKEDKEKYSIKDRFKESGLFGLTKDFFKNFKNDKEIPIKEDKEKYSIKDRFKESGLFGLTKDFFKNFKPFSSSTEKSPDKPSLLNSIKNLLPKSEPKRLTKDETKSSKVLLDGITEEGFRDLADKVPNILKGIFKEKKEDKKEKREFSEGGLLGLLGPGLLGLLKGALMAGGGIALLLGGVAALITGLNTEGPFKGLLKILSKVGLTGGLKLLEKGAQVFLKNIKSLINTPVNVMKMAYKGLRGIFGKGISKTITTVIGKSVGLLAKMATGLVKFITPLLKRMWLVGTVISLSFAYSRFKSGDVIGGVIDVLSGIANLVPGAGTAISIGLDVLNAFLDFKAGGSGKEAAAKKQNMIGDFLGGIGKWIYEKSRDLPLIGRLIKAGEAFSNKDWAKGLMQLSRFVPGTGWIMDFLGVTEEKQEQGIGKSLNIISDLMTWMKESIWDKITGFLKGIIDSAKEKIGDYISNLSWDPRSWIGMDVNQKTPPTTSPTNEIKLAEGGVVTQPTQALIGEAGPEAVVPLDQYMSPEGFKISNDILQTIASNTGNTNDTIKNLSQAILKLAEVFNQKSTPMPNNIIVNGQNQPSQYPSASQIAANNVDPIRAVRAQFAV